MGWNWASAFPVLQLILLVSLGTAALALPRKPDVYKDGLLVTPEHSRSALSRFTFEFCGVVLERARNKGTLDMEDLPQMVHEIRSEELSHKWRARANHRSLLVSLLMAYGWRMAFQFFLSFIQAIDKLGPPLAIFKLLSLLERERSDEDTSQELWMWVAILTVTIAFAWWIEGMF